MNRAILFFRLQRLWNIIREIPTVYLILLSALVGALIVALYQYTINSSGAIITGCVLLLLLTSYHANRKDYRFLFHIAVKPSRIFLSEYLSISFPILLLETIHRQWLAILIIIVGSFILSLLPQQTRKKANGLPPPSIIPTELFEIRSGYRRRGIWFILLYTGMLLGVFVPFLSLGFLFLYTTIYTELYQYGEPTSLLCSTERSVQSFLHNKLYKNMRFYLFSILPVCFLYTLLHQAHWWLIIIFILYGTSNIALIIVTKYAYYQPQKRILTGSIPIGISLFGMLMPLLLPLTLLYLIKNYMAARHNLIHWLYAYNTKSTRSI